jgi:Mrp family chromosome partitioning ATPase
MIKRRWPAIVAAATIMLAFAWLTVPSASQTAREKRQDVSYRAAHTMISEGYVGESLARLSLLLTAGKLPNEVAKEMSAGRVQPQPPDAPKGTGRRRGRTASIGSSTVRVVGDAGTGSLSIIVFDRNPERAVRMANLFADKLKTYLETRAKAEYDSQYKALSDSVAVLRTRVDALRPLREGPDPNGRITYNAALNELRQGEARLANFENHGPSLPQLRTLTEAHAVKIVNEVGFQTPRSRTTRLLLGLLIGLVLGLGIAMALERLDSSIRGIASAEKTSQLPVIADIPYVRIRKSSRYHILSLTMPKSLFAEAYRGLRTSISLMSMAHTTALRITKDGSDEPIPVSVEPKVILIASPGPSEGKSTTAANLATTYSGMGSSVIVIDLDFRRQKLHRFFHTTAGPHLENIGTLDDPRIDFAGLIQPTSVPGVRFLPSAPRNTVPEHALLLARAAIAHAREVADVVILDAPPLLLTNDAKDLIPYADALVLLAREGKTHRKALERACELLRRFDAPVVGLALIGAHTTSSYGYYGYYGYGYGYGQKKPPRSRVTRPTAYDDEVVLDPTAEAKPSRLRVWPRR